VPRAGDHHESEARATARAAHALRTSNLTSELFCGCARSPPVDSIVETHILEYHARNAATLNTKEMLYG